jgi:hypothetical protein
LAFACSLFSDGANQVECIGEKVKMSRYKYASPFRVWNQFDSQTYFESYDLQEAVENARRKPATTMILAEAECFIAGKPTTEKVGIYVWKADGKTEDEIYALFDGQVDRFIEVREKALEAGFGRR